MNDIQSLIINSFRKNITFVLSIFFMGIVAVVTDIFYHTILSDSLLLITVLFWIKIVKVFSFKSLITFQITLFLLILLFIVYIFGGQSAGTERISVLIFFFLSIGLVQQLLELNERKK